MHPSLKRQIKRELGEHFAISPKWRVFFESVSKTYADLDEYRVLVISLEKTRIKVEKQAQNLALQVARRKKELDGRILELEDARKAASNLLEDLDEERLKLAEAKAKDEAMLTSIGDGLIAVDSGAKIVRINSSVGKMLGPSQEEVLGKRFFDTFPLLDVNGKFVLEKEHPMTASLASGSTTSSFTVGQTYYRVRKDGVKFPVAMTTTPIMLKGKIIGAIEVFRDITREKELDLAKSNFVSLASHQLRTPLTGIEWTTELFIRKEKLTDEGKKYLHDIISSTQRLNALVKLLLSASRIDGGGLEVKSESFEIVSFMNEFLKKLTVLSEKKQLTVSFTDHPAALSALTDKSLLEQIIQNLIGNAIDYTLDKGKVSVSLEEKKDIFRIEISDTGIGIPKQDQEKMFKRFIRASNAVHVKPDGTGLGLYIASEATKLLGGKIWFESEEGKGSTFFVELPLQTLAKEGKKQLVDHTFE